MNANEALSAGAQKLLARVRRTPLPLRYGRSGWRPSVSLPVGVIAADFDELVKSRLVKVQMAQLVSAN